VAGETQKEHCCSWAYRQARTHGRRACAGGPIRPRSSRRQAGSGPRAPEGLDDAHALELGQALLVVGHLGQLGRLLVVPAGSRGEQQGSSRAGGGQCQQRPQPPAGRGARPAGAAKLQQQGAAGSRSRAPSQAAGAIDPSTRRPQAAGSRRRRDAPLAPQPVVPEHAVGDVAEGVHCGQRHNVEPDRVRYPLLGLLALAAGGGKGGQGGRKRSQAQCRRWQARLRSQGPANGATTCQDQAQPSPEAQQRTC
jgi:hypothetical protein